MSATTGFSGDHITPPEVAVAAALLFVVGYYVIRWLRDFPRFLLLVVVSSPGLYGYWLFLATPLSRELLRRCSTDDYWTCFALFIGTLSVPAAATWAVLRICRTKWPRRDRADESEEATAVKPGQGSQSDAVFTEEQSGTRRDAEDESALGAYALVGVARLKALTGYTRLSDLGHIPDEVDPGSWNFFATVAAVHAGLVHLSAPGSDADLLSRNMAVVHAKLEAWDEGAMAALSDLDTHHAAVMTRLSEERDDDRFVYPDALGLWVVTNCLGRNPSTPKELQLVRYAGLLATVGQAPSRRRLPSRRRATDARRGDSDSKLRAILIAGAITLAVLLFAFFVWPTPYEYLTSSDGKVMRRHRFTNRVQVWRGYGSSGQWYGD